MADKRKYVIPGDVVTSGPFRPEQNVILEGNDIIATAVGISEIYDDSVKVIPLTGKYLPKIDDLVIGKVVSHTSLSWELDINSCYIGFLPAQDVFGRDFSTHADELSSKLKTGDLVAARIANFDRTRDPLITISDRDLGKIDDGVLVKISTSKVPRLIGKKGSMIQMIENGTNAAVTIGQNGWVVVSCETDEGLSKIAKAKEMSYQILKAGKTMKLDIEKALFDNNAKVTGSATAARELAGAPTWLTSNTVKGSGGADANGTGSNARTDGTQTVFTQAKFDTVMQSVWENGGTGSKTAYLSAFNMTKCLGFAGNNNQRANVVGADERVINSISIYLTPWGEISLRPTRENRSRDVFLMQNDTWQVATLRPMKNVELSKTGDNSKRQLTTELTLVCTSEAANGMVADCTTS